MRRIRSAARTGVLRVRIANRDARVWSAGRRKKLRLIVVTSDGDSPAARRKAKKQSGGGTTTPTTPPPSTTPAPTPTRPLRRSDRSDRPTAPTGGTVLLSDNFEVPLGLNSLITNEYAFWNLSDLLAVRAPRWEMTSGSLFSKNGVGWTGVPDLTAPDRYSQRSTGSSVFRLRTARSDFGNVLQTASARINGFYGFPDRPAVAWDGVVLWPRYLTEFNLYFAYALRKDGRVSLTKKCPGGTSGDPNYYNGGTYYDLTPETYYAPTVLGQWYSLATSAKDNPDGSVTIKLYRDGNVVAQATDSGSAARRSGRRASSVSGRTTRTRTSLSTRCRPCPDMKTPQWVSKAASSS